MTPAGRRRLSSGGAEETMGREESGGKRARTRPQKPASRKVRLTPEGRKRLAEAMKRRWAVKRAASAVKTTGRKGTARCEEIGLKIGRHGETEPNRELSGNGFATSDVAVIALWLVVWMLRNIRHQHFLN